MTDPVEKFADRPRVVIASGMIDYHCDKCDGPCKLPAGHVHVDYVDGKAIADMRRYEPGEAMPCPEHRVKLPDGSCFHCGGPDA